MHMQIKSNKDKEDEEVAEMLAKQFKARPLNKRVLESCGDLGVPVSNSVRTLVSHLYIECMYTHVLVFLLCSQMNQFLNVLCVRISIYSCRQVEVCT